MHRLLDERKARFGQARHRLERDGKRPTAVCVGAEERIVAGEPPREREPRDVRLRIAADLDLERAEAESERRLVAGAEVVAVTAERNLHGHLAPVRPAEQLGDGDPLRAPSASHSAVETPAFVNQLPRRTRSNSVACASIGASGLPTRAGPSTSRTKCVAVTASSPLQAAVALTSPEALDALVGDDANERERRGGVHDALAPYLQRRLRTRAQGRCLDGRDSRPRHVTHLCRRAARRRPRRRPRTP